MSSSWEDPQSEEEEERHSVCMDPEAGDSYNLFSKDPVTACTVSWTMYIYVVCRMEVGVCRMEVGVCRRWACAG